MKAMLSVLCVLAFAVGVARAENSIVVESKTAAAGATGVRVGVFLNNDVPIVGVLLPLELRSVTLGSYVTGQFKFGRGANGRVARMMNNCYEDFLPRRMAVPASPACSGPVAETFGPSAAQIDFVSPDAVLDTPVGCGDVADPFLSWAILPSSDVPVTDSASWYMTFNVTTTSGQFEIDTCCVRPAVHLAFVDTLAQTIIPSFSKGIITIAECVCPCVGDPNCDGASDIVDVIETISVAFRGGIAEFDPACPVARTDLNADGVTDIVDAVRITFIAFMGYSPGANLVNPCQ